MHLDSKNPRDRDQLDSVLQQLREKARRNPWSLDLEKDGGQSRLVLVVGEKSQHEPEPPAEEEPTELDAAPESKPATKKPAKPAK